MQSTYFRSAATIPAPPIVAAVTVKLSEFCASPTPQNKCISVNKTDGYRVACSNGFHEDYLAEEWVNRVDGAITGKAPRECNVSEVGNVVIEDYWAVCLRVLREGFSPPPLRSCKIDYSVIYQSRAGPIM